MPPILHKYEVKPLRAIQASRFFPDVAVKRQTATLQDLLAIVGKPIRQISSMLLRNRTVDSTHGAACYNTCIRSPVVTTVVQLSNDECHSLHYDHLRAHERLYLPWENRRSQKKDPDERGSEQLPNRTVT